MLDPVQNRVLGSTGDYSWGGAASTIFWVDPVEEIVGMFLTQLLPSSTYPIREEFKSLVAPGARRLNVSADRASRNVVRHGRQLEHDDDRLARRRVGEHHRLTDRIVDDRFAVDGDVAARRRPTVPGSDESRTQRPASQHRRRTGIGHEPAP